jgi:alanyl-tRNA synthetase
MNQFKKEFMGIVKDARRVTTCQKCLRTLDLEKVGKTPRHHSFFEMLGNFSFGDYFKKETIVWAWEFLTQDLGLDPERLWVSIYRDDEEAYCIWTSEVRLPEDKISRLDEKENFWPANAPRDGPNGPCGPCSEIFFDRGNDKGCGRPGCGPGCDCDRFVEIWNLVFTQFNRKDGGILEPLPNRNIDTGMGLERMVAVLQGVNTNFEIDIFKPIVKAIKDMATESADKQSTVYAISDHIRAVTFAIADGAIPSNEERGYVIRRLIRKAAWYGHSLGLDEPFLYRIVPIVVKVMSQTYPEIAVRRENISQIVLHEEEKFSKTLDDGTHLITRVMGDLTEKKIRRIPADVVFKLYDTYGFPVDLVESMASASGFDVDREGYEKLLNEQRRRSRATSTMTGEIFKGGISQAAESLGVTNFVGYDSLDCNGKVIGIFVEERAANEVHEGQDICIVLDTTVFYGESGGQVGDTGTLEAAGVKVEVSDAKRSGDVILHFGRITKGTVRSGDALIARIDRERRMNIARHHTATHLLQSALRQVLGAHVMQSGSMVDDERLRFDFSHFQGVSRNEIERVEDIVNEQIRVNSRVGVSIMPFEDAKKSGVIALFGEKYGALVRMVSVGSFSRELCGGTHLSSTGEIGLFRIMKESSIAAGIRRIEAAAGEAAYELMKMEREKIDDVARTLKTSPEKVVSACEELAQDHKELTHQVEILRAKMAEFLAVDIAKRSVSTGAIPLVTYKVDDADIDFLRVIVDRTRTKIAEAVLVLGSSVDQRVYLIVSVSDKLVKQGMDAGKIARQVASIVGGSGGGKPQLAQAGGKFPGKLDEALAAVPGIVANLTDTSTKR